MNVEKIEVGERIFEKGKCYIVYGVNGSGKTTLLTSIFTLTPFFKEDVFINGLDARKYNKKEQRSIREQMLYLKSKNNLINYLSNSENNSVLNKNSAEINLFKGKTTQSMSSGEEEISSLTLLEYTDKKILLLDEVTKYMDEANLNKALNIIERLINEDRIILIATHDTRVKIKEAEITYISYKN